MKINYFLLSILPIMVCSCQKREDIKVPLIEYDVLINNQNRHYSWFDNISGYNRTKLISLLLEKVTNPSFIKEDCKGNKIQSENSEDFFNQILLPDSLKANKQFFIEYINGLRFSESWKINSKSGQIDKKVISIGLLHFSSHLVLNDSLAAPQLLFRIYPDSLHFGKDNSTLVCEKISYDMPISNSSAFITETYGENLLWYFSNIEPETRLKFVNLLLENGLEGKISIYDYFFNELSKKDILKIKEKTDTIRIETDSSPDGYRDTIIRTKPEKANILKIKCIESWEIDTASLEFKKKLIALCPSEELYDNSGNLKGYKPLFWLLYDKSMKDKLVFE